MHAVGQDAKAFPWAQEWLALMWHHLTQCRSVLFYRFIQWICLLYGTLPAMARCLLPDDEDYGLGLALQLTPQSNCFHTASSASGA